MDSQWFLEKWEILDGFYNKTGEEWLQFSKIEVCCILLLLPPKNIHPNGFLLKIKYKLIFSPKYISNTNDKLFVLISTYYSREANM